MEQLLNRLLEERAQVANSALMTPADRSAFEYGRVSGQYQGLTMAIEMVQAALSDNEEDEG